MTTTDPDDVRRQHAAALAHLEACQQRVKELNSRLISERWELFSQQQSIQPMRVHGLPGAPPGTTIPWVHGVNIEGSRRVAVDTDPLVARQARLDLPQALHDLARAEIDEQTLRPLVDALDAEERHREKLKRLPAVQKAYRDLDKALTKAAALRGAVVQAIARVGEVSPTDAGVMMSLTWPELSEAQLEHRRAMVRSWCAQANGDGAS